MADECARHAEKKQVHVQTALLESKPEVNDLFGIEVVSNRLETGIAQARQALFEPSFRIERQT